MTCIEHLKQFLCEKSRTAKLWIQYLEYVDVVKQYIRAARNCDWNLYLVSLQKMLNLFAASGHINYAKSARLYLQKMLQLKEDEPRLYQKLSSECMFFINRTEKQWSGLWTDLVIEQVLMRAIKNRGGLTRGRSMTESVCILWTHSMHITGSISHTMSELTNNMHQTSEQHKELGESRKKQDHDDQI